MVEKHVKFVILGIFGVLIILSVMFKDMHPALIGFGWVMLFGLSLFLFREKIKFDAIKKSKPPNPYNSQIRKRHHNV